MQFKFSFLTGLFVVLSISFLSAQGSASVNTKKPNILEPSQFTTSTDEWAFYFDNENKVYYIDFESINVNLSDIKLFNQAGEMVKSDKLWDLPVNTIYELDIHDLKPGNYKIELRSYTGVIEREITLSE